MNNKQASVIPCGTRVQIRGIKSRADLNGSRGVIVDAFNPASGRCVVKIDGTNGGTFAMKPVNIVPLVHNDRLIVESLIQVYDEMSNEERMRALEHMPADCHVCGGDEETDSPDAGTGYTRLICTVCVTKVLLSS